MTSAREGWDVLVAGYGPAGVACANLLGAQGIRTLVIERDPDVFPRQRAISIDDEALRIIRAMGLYGQVTSHMHLGVTLHFIGLDGKPFMRVLPLPTEHCGESQANFFHQPYLEADLRAGVERYPSVEVRMGAEVSSVADHGDHVSVTVRDLQTGEDSEVRATYVLACDGGSSGVRKQVGIQFAGSSYSEQWLDVQAKVKRPFRETPHFRFICDPVRPGVDCPCPGGYHRWEWRINPGEDADAMQQPENLWKLLGQRGITPDDVEIHRHWEYTFHVRCSERWRVGRVLLVGDAAHVMPPFAGQGISGAFRDASNICWKLGAVLAGRADERLLDTYETERRAHHEGMSRAAVRIGRLVMPPNRPLARVRDAVLGVLTRIPAVTRKISREAIRPLPLVDGYLGPRGGRKSPVGQLAPLVDVFTSTGRRMKLDEAVGNRFAVLSLEVQPSELLPPEVREAWQALGAFTATVRSGTSVVGEGELGDPVGLLWDWFKRHGARVLVLRPDRYVYAAGAGPDIPLPALMATPQPEAVPA